METAAIVKCGHIAKSAAEVLFLIPTPPAEARWSQFNND